MIRYRDLLLPVLIVAAIHSTAALGQSGPKKSANPLEPLAFLTGGLWVGEYELPDGSILRQERTYEWTLDKKLIKGQSFRFDKGKRLQTRETVFAWDGEKIVFWDFIDEGGFGSGTVEVKAEAIFMQAKIIGSRHVDWRAWLRSDSSDRMSFELEVPNQGKWVKAGTFALERRKR